MAPADEIVPRPVLDGLPALPPVIFSDYFRYKLQQLGRGTWVDSDVYCVKPFVFDKNPVFGWQKRDGWQGKRYLNNAILRLEPDSPLTTALVDVFERNAIAEWLPLRKRLELRFKGRAAPARVEEVPWAWTGPKLLTWCAQRLGLAHHACRADVFYPLRAVDSGVVATPSFEISSLIKPETLCVHLWRTCLSEHLKRRAPAGTFLAVLQQEGA